MTPRPYVPPSPEEGYAWAPRFTATAELTDVGMSGTVAEELERRMEIVAQEELAGDASRQPLSTGELLGYVGTVLAICLVGILVVIL
ncbi:hypothetical protein [Micrococcus terreus]|uniref:Uncharacterized protein n=1 Tax=Micrococcus terreus TaxID=574650 RepID=A0A1I7MPW5_9MICC|nr:hypothetical protein [Micrococcus terreus]SFV23938.1 hypothetical protein SAMN04487966_10927 [Micrococcus terreus]